jgi:hypothetical protein
MLSYFLTRRRREQEAEARLEELRERLNEEKTARVMLFEAYRELRTAASWLSKEVEEQGYNTTKELWWAQENLRNVMTHQEDIALKGGYK